MSVFCKIRNGFKLGICGLACLIFAGVAIAQTGSSTGAKKPASTSSTKTHSSAATSSHHSSSAHKSSTHGTAQKTRSKNSHGKKSAKKRGQQVIDGERARAIQEALIREHYMQGEPSGSWDSATQAAMQRYQADQGWQSKTTPDSRALIKLGLGPSHDHLLNPESAMTTSPGVSKAAEKPGPSENSVPQE